MPTAAKAELQNDKRFKLTLAFWLTASYVVGCVVYTIGSWWWTCFIWLAVAAAITVIVVLFNKGRLKRRNKSAKA